MKQLVSKCLVLALLLLPVTCLQAGQGSGAVVSLLVNPVDVLIFEVEMHTNPPPCSNHQWAISLNEESGRAMYTLLLSAAAQGLSVYVTGWDDCAHWGDRERPRNIMVLY